MLEKTLESPLDCKEIQPVHSEGDQPWDFFGRTDAKAEAPILWPPHSKSWLIGKGSDAGRGWGQEEKGTTEDEMAGWHHWLDGQGGLACCDSWGCEESDTIERLIWSDLKSEFGEEILDWTELSSRIVIYPGGKPRFEILTDLKGGYSFALFLLFNSVCKASSR